MMKINIKLVGLFKTGRFKQKDFLYSEGILVSDVIEDLQIPLTLLGIVLINEVHSDTNSPLREGDALVLLPLLEGG